MNLTVKILVLLFCLKLIKINAQQPQPIYSFATQLQSTEWYKEQVLAWKNEINKDNKNALAWYNYYRATRNVNRKDTTDKRPFKEKQEVEKKIIEDMSKIVPESFEYNLCKWMIEGNDIKYLSYLKKAAELGENREEIISDMINWGEIERNIEMRDKYAKRWFDSKMASPGLLNYNYNVIIGLKPNAILLTVGDNDTYPIWQLQAQGIRRDVTIINLYLINIDSYRDKVFKHLNIPKWDTTLYTQNQKENPNYFREDIIKHIASNSSSSPVYIALTTANEYTVSIEDNLYLTGLAYEYSKQNIDNIATLKKNFEQLYKLDYIEQEFYKDISAYYTKCVNQNYIVPMLKLYNHYKEAGDTQKQQWIKQKITILAKDSNEESDILKHLN